jgi:hypothetical protein
LAAPVAYVPDRRREEAVMATTETSLERFQRDEDVTRAEVSVKTEGDEVRADCTLWFTATMNASAADIWKFAKDFNAWQDDLDYNCVIGDQPEGTGVYFHIAPAFHEQYSQNYGVDVTEFRKDLIVRFVDPDQLLVLEELSSPTNVLSQWVGDEPPKGREIAAYYVLGLWEEGGKTKVAARFTYAPTFGPKESEDQLRTSFEAMGNEVTARWKDKYLPSLRRLVEGG